MALGKNLLLGFNRGIVSALGLCRIDVSRMAWSAETQTNIMPRVLGSAMLRPGWKYIADGSTESVGTVYKPAVNVPFVRSATEKALLEFTGTTGVSGNGGLRIMVNDVFLTRPAITDNLVNGFFIDNLNGWTDSDEAGASSVWADSGNPLNGWMHLTGTGINAAIREQEVTVADTGVEHALHVRVRRGPVVLRVGSSAGAEDYIAETSLDTGEYSLAFTPSGNFHIHLSSRLKYTVRVSQCTLEAAADVELITAFDDDDLPFIRHAQSGDIVFIACKDHQQQRVMRFGERSWGFGEYKSESGPFRPINITDVTMTPSVLEGNATITASKDFFRAEHVGALIRIASNGQEVSRAITAEDTFTDPIRVVGTEDARIFNIIITGSFTATVTVQYSVGEPGAWVDLATTYSAPTTTTHDDGLNNQIIYYRIGVKTGDYGTGTVNVELNIASGSIRGIARIDTFTSATSVAGRVIKAFGGTDASKNWWESDWSGYRGWPSAVAFHEGRLAWAGRDKIWLSISDSYYSFDDFFEGDAGPISRNIGFGPIQDIFWLLSQRRLVMGTATNASNVPSVLIDGNSPIVARSTGFDEPLTPTNFNLKVVSPIGLFVDRSGQRLTALEFDGDDHIPSDLSLFTPDLNAVGISGFAVQMKPDIRIHCWRADGGVSVLVFDRAENVAAWVEVETDGDVEHVTVLPGDSEDDVYYFVKRTIDGNTVRYHEKWALESECQGGTLNKQADAFFEYSGASTASITGLDHLEGETVFVWGSGKDLGSYTVASGSITLTEAVTSCIVGLTYRGRFKGAKLGSMFEGGLNNRRKVSKLGLNLLNAHHKGIRYGPSFDELYDLPQTKDEKSVAADTVHSEYAVDVFDAGGNWSNDSRLHLEMNAPKPCTIQAATLVVDG